MTMMNTLQRAAVRRFSTTTSHAVVTRQFTSNEPSKSHLEAATTRHRRKLRPVHPQFLEQQENAAETKSTGTNNNSTINPEIDGRKGVPEMRGGSEAHQLSATEKGRRVIDRSGFLSDNNKSVVVR
jgi:hypothetical protein